MRIYYCQFIFLFYFVFHCFVFLMLLPSFVSWWLSIVICSVFPFFFLCLCSRLLLCSYHDVYLHKTSCEWKMLPAAAAKLLQSCLSLCNPIDSSPLGSPSQGFSGQDHWSGLPFPSPVHESESESEVAQSCLTLSNPWTAAYQAPPSVGFSRQEYWSGLPLSTPKCCLPYQ